MKLSNISNSFRRNQKQEETDLGFGTKIMGHRNRLINKDGSFNVVRTGISTWTPYQSIVEMSWARFFLFVTIFYCFVNAFFAFILVFIGVDSLPSLIPGDLMDNFVNAFFFSVQTFTTLGYGVIHPEGIPANIVASAIALVGLMSFALVTGLFFARFSKPKAQILFSKNVIITPYRDITSFQFRIANLRNNHIINLEAKVTMSWVEEEAGIKRRRFSFLKLERKKVTLFPLNWTIVHPIDDNSPLFKKTPPDLLEMQAEFLILIEGYDETFAQRVHINSSYTCEEIIWDVKFAAMYRSDNGKTILELEKIHEFTPIGKAMQKEEEE